MNSVAFAMGPNHSLAVWFPVPHEILVMDLQKIAKVLALAASDNDAEALHALRTARRLLEAQGADFVELASRVGQAAGAGRNVLEDAVFDLRNEVRQLRAENERLKQGRGPGETANIFDAARNAADAIRLRAEMAELADLLERERAQAAAHMAALRDELSQAASTMARLPEAEARRMRLEAENRRLLHANHALSAELEEARASKPAMGELIDHDIRPERKPRGNPRGKVGLNQYALF